MPIIPSDLQPISMDVPGMTVSAPTATSTALSRLGHDMSQVGFALAEEVQKAEAVDTSTKAILEHGFESEDYVTQLMAKYPTGVITDENGKPVMRPDNKGFKTITDQYQEWSAEKYKAGQEAMGSSLAQQMYRERAAPMFYGQLSKVRNNEQIFKTEEFQKNQDRNLKLGMNRQVESPNPTSAYQLQQELLRQLEAQRSTLRMSPQEYEARVQMIQKDIPNAVLHGYESLALSYQKGSARRIDYVNQALSVLHGQDPDSRRRAMNGLPKFEDTMSPEAKAAWIKKFEEMKLQVAKLDGSDWNRRVEMASNQAKSPEGVTDGMVNGLITEGKALLRSGSITPFQYANQTAQLNTYKYAFPVIESDEFRLASREKKEAIAEKLVQESFEAMMSDVPPEQQQAMRQAGFPAREWIRDEVARKIEKVEKLAQDDPVKFAQFDRSIRNTSAQIDLSRPYTLENPAMAQAYRERNQQLDNLFTLRGESQSPAYLTQIEVKQLASVLKNPRLSYTDISRTLKALHQADPTKYIATLEQVINSQENVSPAWYMALLIDRPNLSTLTDEVVEAIVSKGKYPNASELLKTHGMTIDQVRSQLITGGKPYFANLIKKTGSPLNTLEQEAVVDTLFTMTMKKIQGDGAQPSQAIEQTLKQLIGAKYHIKGEISHGFMRGSQTLLMPTYSAGRELTEVDHKNILRNLQTMKDHIPALEPDVPHNLDPVLVPKWLDHFLANPDNTEFVYNERKNVYNIKWKNTKVGTTHFLMKNGEVIELPVDQLTVYRPENRTTTEKVTDTVTEGASNFLDTAKKKFEEFRKGLF